MLNMKEGDLCILFAFPRYNTAMVRLMRWMKKRKVKIVLVASALIPLQVNMQIW